MYRAAPVDKRVTIRWVFQFIVSESSWVTITFTPCTGALQTRRLAFVAFDFSGLACQTTSLYLYGASFVSNVLSHRDGVVVIRPGVVSKILEWLVDDVQGLQQPQEGAARRHQSGAVDLVRKTSTNDTTSSRKRSRTLNPQKRA